MKPQIVSSLYHKFSRRQLETKRIWNYLTTNFTTCSLVTNSSPSVPFSYASSLIQQSVYGFDQFNTHLGGLLCWPNCDNVAFDTRKHSVLIVSTHGSSMQSNTLGRQRREFPYFQFLRNPLRTNIRQTILRRTLAHAIERFVEHLVRTGFLGDDKILATLRNFTAYRLVDKPTINEIYRAQRKDAPIVSVYHTNLVNPCAVKGEIDTLLACWHFDYPRTSCVVRGGCFSIREIAAVECAQNALDSRIETDQLCAFETECGRAEIPEAKFTE